MSKVLHRLSITVPENFYEQVTGILALYVNFGWRETSLPTGETVFTIHCENPVFLADLRQKFLPVCPDVVIENGEETTGDWLHSWREFFTPVLCGSRFVILPPWLKDENFGSRMKIIINPKSAFGTGHHATTTLCLTALSDLLDAGRIKPGASFLDLGCGTGVLGISAQKSGLSGMGLDIDPLAVENSRENAALNNATSLEIREGSIECAGDRKYDLIMANILAAPLIDMSHAIASRLATGGALILSGILDIQADKVDAAFRACGLPPARQKEDGEWRALIYS